MISTVGFPDFLEPPRKSLISLFLGLGHPRRFVKALFIQVQVDWVSEKVVNPKDGKTWGRENKLKNTKKIKDTL